MKPRQIQRTYAWTPDRPGTSPAPARTPAWTSSSGPPSDQFKAEMRVLVRTRHPSSPLRPLHNSAASCAHRTERGVQRVTEVCNPLTQQKKIWANTGASRLLLLQHYRCQGTAYSESAGWWAPSLGQTGSTKDGRKRRITAHGDLLWERKTEALQRIHRRGIQITITTGLWRREVIICQFLRLKTE